MSEIVTTEHCFNFHDAEHKDKTNRYVFNYPEIWYVNQTIKDMALGIRSIILKPEPIYVQLQDIFAIGTNTEVETTLKEMEVRPVINQEVILSNRLPIRIQQHIDEKIDMLTFVNMANENFERDYSEFKDIIYNYYEDKSLLDVSKNSINWLYDKEGNLTLRAANNNMLAVRIYDGGNCGTFNEGFHKLVGLDYNNITTNLNTIMGSLMSAFYEGEVGMIIETITERGIIISNDITLEYDYIYEVTSGQPPRYYLLKFSSITFKNVWSRKDVLLTSSISEMDKRGYLGFSSNYSNSAQAIYPQPKMFDINNTESKFWVDLFDSYTQKSIQLLGGNLLLIEAVVVQKPKRTFNRT